MHESSTDQAPARRARILGKGAVAAIGAIPIGLLVSGMIVWQSSYAAFTAVADGGSNSWSTGTVALSGDDGSSSGGATGTAMFAPTNLRPGSTGSNCVEVSYNGTLAAAVKVYIKPGGLTGSAALASQLDVTIAEGTGGAFNNCAGFTPGATTFTGTLAGLAAASTNFGSGAGAWAPSASGQKQTYRVTYTLKSTAPTSVQGTSAGATVTWEAQNT
ncbi:MAG: hypothetical protein ABIM89_10200 [Mycobacteriales bacterium]